MAALENEPYAMAVFDHATRHLMASAKASPQAASAAAYAFLQCEGAGYPSVQLLEEDARRDAAYWAETATPAELECYFVAAAMRLSEISTFTTSRHIKRLIATLWGRMSPEERAAFLVYAGKN